MHVELLPSSVPVSESQFLVSFLINDRVAIDAGPLGLLADLGRQRGVRQIFLTHEHVDHIASLPIFLDNVYEPGPDCVELLGGANLLDFLHRDIFNGRVWPDFFDLSTDDNRFVRATPLEPGQSVIRSGLTVTAVPVQHSVDTFGYLVDDGDKAVAFPSDTGPTEGLWTRLGTAPRLDAVFLEVSFPDSLADLATTTGHHCPASFAAEIGKLSRPVRWIVVHRKPRYADQIATELGKLDLPHVELAIPGCVYEF